MTELEFKLIWSVFFISLLFLSVFIDLFLRSIFLLFVFDDKTNFRWSGSLFFPPLYFIVINNSICFAAWDFISLISQHEDVSKLLSIGLIMCDFLYSVDEPWYDLKLWIFWFSVVMCEIMGAKHFGEFLRHFELFT